MAQRDTARGRAGTWPDEAARRRPASWPKLTGFAETVAAHLRDWAAAETGPGRLAAWTPVAFGFGIVLYFTAEREPAWWAAGALALGTAVGAFLVRRRALALPVALLATALTAGFAIATVRTGSLAHPVLRQSAANVAVTGFVEIREERERSDRIVMRVHKIDGARLSDRPERVRVAVRKGTAPAVGAYVSLTARLNPPLSPLRPGGYDFARDLYFRGIGAIGFALGTIKSETPPSPPPLSLRFSGFVDAVRDGIDRRIRASIPGDAGSIASALITGKRDAISTPVNDAMYVSSLAHVLSISGYHMAVVAGVVFFAVRATLALSAGLATRRPIKKWAAGAALVAAACYLVLSGAEIATQRAFTMTAIVLVGVMADRPALTLRTLAVAALAVMLLTPEAVVHPSFQMSFAATLALVAVYERGIPWISGAADTSLGARLALWGAREIAALVLASLVAGLATMPYAAYHFHRLAPYGVLANLLAMPIVSAWVMPAGLFALVVLPFGFDGPLWQLMGLGIDWMIAVAQWVASLPGAVGRIAAFGIAPLLVGTAGLIVICLLRTPLRWGGLALIVAGVLLAVATPRPDVLVAANGDTFAVRAADGRLAVMRTGNDAFAARDWLAADGDARAVNDASLAQGFSCDAAGCIARLADGTVVALARSAEAFAEDCGRAALVLSAREAPPDCAATVVDRRAWRTGGALALRQTGDGWSIDSARPATMDRPWAPAAAAGSEQGRAPTATRPTARDVTPRREDLEAGD
jgi:competence protein ComEC